MANVADLLVLPANKGIIFDNPHIPMHLPLLVLSPTNRMLSIQHAIAGKIVRLYTPICLFTNVTTGIFVCW